MPTHKSNSFKAFEAERERSNPMVATLASRLVDIRKRNIAECLSDIEGSAHKLELVKTFNGIDFIDDAHANNVNAVWLSLDNMTKPCIWINQINDPDLITDELKKIMSEKVKAVILQSVYNREVYVRFAETGIPIFTEMNMEDAVRQAFYACEKNYAVLYSPGVKGPNQMTIREMGAKFQAAVAQL